MCGLIGRGETTDAVLPKVPHLSLPQYIIVTIATLRHHLSRASSLCSIVPHYKLLFIAHALKHFALLLTRPSFTLCHHSRKRRANTNHHTSSCLRIIYDSPFNMSTLYRITNPSASAQSSLSFDAQAIQAVSSSSSPQQPANAAPTLVTGEKRSYIAAFGEYDGSSPQLRKKRKLDNSPHPDTREYVPKTVAAMGYEMVDVVGTAKLHQLPAPPTSPPDFKNAILRMRSQSLSASPLTESADAPCLTSNSPAARPLNPPPTPRDTSPAPATSPRTRSRAKKKEPTVVPPDSMFVPMPRACGHTRHPAYAGSYIVPLCPRCCLEFALDQLRVIQHAIEDKGGARHFRETDRVKYTEPPLHGYDSKHPEGSFVIGMDISYRHCKKRLANLMTYLEIKAAEEAGWEQQEMRKYPWLTPSQVDYLHFSRFLEHSARSALQHYSHLEAEGCLTLVDDHNRIAAHDHAMKMPIDNEEVSRTHIVKKSNGKAPMADAYNPHFSRFGGAKTPDVDNESHPKRMRRDPKSKVSFETEVKVCVVNNVDVLRKRASAYPVTTGTLPRSILCTAAIEDFQDNDPKRPSVNFTTKHKSETMDLKSESTERRRQKQFKRRSSTYKPGSWACSSDCEIIDTSGARRSFEEFKSYNTKLDTNAGYLDAAEEQLLKMNNERASIPTKGTPSESRDPRGFHSGDLIQHIWTQRLNVFASLDLR
jgi:hypothetical protein